MTTLSEVVAIQIESLEIQSKGMCTPAEMAAFETLQAYDNIRGDKTGMKSVNRPSTADLPRELKRYANIAQALSTLAAEKTEKARKRVFAVGVLRSIEDVSPERKTIDFVLATNEPIQPHDEQYFHKIRT